MMQYMLRLGAACAVLVLPRGAEATILGEYSKARHEVSRPAFETSAPTLTKGKVANGGRDEADGCIRGRVVNATTREPIERARVAVVGSNRSTWTGSDGSYLLSAVSEGRRTLVVERSGYDRRTANVAVASNDTVVADFDLSPIATELRRITTTAKGGGTLMVPSAAEATVRIEQTPGAVDVIADSQFKNGPASTIKDVLNWVPGVTTQTRWGPDARVSIRGSGLSRSYGNRGLNAYMDGIPINTADGLVEFFEMDPTAYRYVEVYKGANALRYGANSLGGAIVFVTPTGRSASPLEARIDAGSFGQARTQLSTGGARGRLDYFVTGSAERTDGFREHSNGKVERLSGNVGIQLSPNAETRFYVNANSWDGRIPGEVSKASALNTPSAANPFWVAQDQQRNINSIRVANKTTLRLGSPASLDLGVFGIARHVDHPIFLYFDYTVADFGGFARFTHEANYGEHRNRFVAGVNLHNGKNDETRNVNLGNATKGPLVSSVIDRSKNSSAYVENSFFVLPNLAVVAGTQFLHATRARTDRILSNGNQSGSNAFDLWTPKAGILWDVNPAWQLFANVSRSSEVPTFDVNTFTSPTNSNLKAQTATTFEIGTRGRRADVTWDVALYRANVRNELQCLTNPSVVGSCVVTNAARTTHQGIEAGLGVALLKSTFATGDRLWFNSTYTYNGFRFDGNALYGNNRLPGVPAHFARGELLYNGARGFFVGPNVEWMPRAFFADNANTLTADAYALLNLRVGIDVARRFSVWAEGRNLADKAYISTAAIAETASPDDERFNPGYGRGVFTGIRMTW